MGLSVARAGQTTVQYDTGMHGVRVGPLVMATIAVVLLFEARLFFTQGSPLFGVLALALAAVCLWYAVRPYVRAGTRRRRALDRAPARPAREARQRSGHPERG